MNKFKLKVLSMVLAAASLSSAVPALGAIHSDVAGTKFEEPVSVLSALKIMIGDDTGLFRPDDTIIRSEVAKIAIHSLGLESAADSMKGVSKFPDVPVEHWANGYINLAAANGIVIGDDTGNFRPNDKITYAEAMTMLVRILGYEPQAIQFGGYPMGYIQSGTANGLSKNVSGNASSHISRGNVAYMTNNALSVKLMEQTGFGQNIKYEVTEKTLLKDKLNVIKGEGQITATDAAALSGTSNLADGQIMIGDKKYDTEYNMNHLLGYNVVYYLDTTDDRDTIILALPSQGKNTEVKISSETLHDIKTKDSKLNVEYFREEGSSKTDTAVISSDAILIFNGKKSELTEEKLNIGSSGKITLLDTTGNGEFDKVFVTKYRNMFVESVSTSGRITDQYGADSITLDDEVDFRITMGADEIKVSDIKKNYVLSVAESEDKKLYTVEASAEKVEGKVSKTNDEGVFIGDKLYKIADNFTETLKAGDERVFYIDAYGKIAGADKKMSENSRYAYLIRAFRSSDNETVNFKLFTTDGKELIITANDKITVNDGSLVNAEDALSTFVDGDSKTIQQLVSYKTNTSGKLISIDTAEDRTSTDSFDENEFAKNFVMSDAVYNAKTSKLNNVTITKDTVVFEIPEGENEYNVRDNTLFEDEQKYNAIVYNVSEDYSAGIVIITNSNLKPQIDAPIAVVVSVATTVNTDGVTTNQLTALVDGKTETFLAKDANTLKKEDGSLVSQGDIVQLKKTAQDEITNINVLFEIADKAVEKTVVNGEYTTIYGKVQKKFASSMNVTVADASAVNIQIPEDVKVYSVDTSKSKNIIKVAETGDIYAYDEADQNRVFITSYKDQVKEIVIVK